MRRLRGLFDDDEGPLFSLFVFSAFGEGLLDFCVFCDDDLLLLVCFLAMVKASFV